MKPVFGKIKVTILIQIRMSKLGFLKIINSFIVLYYLKYIESTDNKNNLSSNFTTAIIQFYK